MQCSAMIDTLLLEKYGPGDAVRGIVTFHVPCVCCDLRAVSRFMCLLRLLCRFTLRAVSSFDWSCFLFVPFRPWSVSSFDRSCFFVFFVPFHPLCRFKFSLQTMLFRADSRFMPHRAVKHQTKTVLERRRFYGMLAAPNASCFASIS